MKSQDKNKKYIETNDTRYIVDTETGELIEVLSDKSGTGRVRPWREKKTSNLVLSHVYSTISDEEDDYWDKKSVRLSDCGTFLKFNVFQNGQEKQMKATQINSCRVRLCPLCGWRRSLKISSHMRRILEETEKTGEYAYILLTLTVPNVKGEDLSDELTNMMKAWNLFAKTKTFQKVVKGWYRGLEITHNKKADTYHPHFHNILAVRKSYFKSRDYISHDEWLKMWQKATKNDNITQIDVRKVKSKGENNDIVGAVCEACKYTLKESDFLDESRWNMTKKVVQVLDNALTNRRLVAYGGIFKELHKKLNLDDEVDGDLVHVGDEPTANDTLIGEVCYYFHVGYMEYIKK